jgi:hypothetical protein
MTATCDRVISSRGPCNTALEMVVLPSGRVVARCPRCTALDAAADGNFGGNLQNRRAGYGDQLEMILRVARKGGTLAAGEGLKLIEHYEALLAERPA